MSIAITDDLREPGATWLMRKQARVDRQPCAHQDADNELARVEPV
jgi:hypothetical protein